MEGRALRCIVAWVALLILLVAAAGAATTSTTARSAAGTGQGSAFDGGGGDVENGTTTTRAPSSAATNNHTYELRCWPRAQLQVDEAPVQVTRAFRAALRVLCVLARAAAQQNLNASAPEWNSRSPGYRFGHLVTEDSYDVSEYRNGAQGSKQLDIVFADGQPVNSSDALAMFSYTCQYGPPGHQLALNERALRRGSAAWVLLGRLACRDWWEARAPPDSAEDEDAAREDSEERAMNAFTRRLRSALRPRGGGVSEGKGRRVARGLLDNRVDELQPFFPPALAGGSRNHSYDISCALHRERLFADGVELQVSRHLQSLVRYMCALLHPHGSHENAGPQEPLYSLGFIVTAERFDPMDYVRDSLMEKKFHVEYLDGCRRHGRHVFPVHVRCAGGATQVSVRGLPLVPRSLSWALLATARCGLSPRAPPVPHAPHAPHATARDDAKEWRLQQQSHPAPPLQATSRLQAPDTTPVFLNGNHDSWRMNVFVSTLTATTPSPASYSSPWVTAVPPPSSYPSKSPAVARPPLPPASSSPAGPAAPPSASSFRAFLLAAFDSTTSTSTVPTPTTEFPSPSTSPRASSLSLSSYPSILKYLPPVSSEYSPSPLTTPQSSPLETVTAQSSTSSPWSYLFPVPSTASTVESASGVSQRVAPTRRHDDRLPHADWRQDATAHVMRDLDEEDNASEQLEQVEEGVLPGNSEEVLPTPERLDSASPNNRVYSSEEYPDDAEDFHNHSYILRCAESGALQVDGEEARITSHMAAALFFLCALLSSAQGARPTAYDFGPIRTVEAYRTEDVAMNGDGDLSLDVLYEGGALPRSQDVNIFWQTCRPDPPGPEFSLDSGPLLPHSIVWSLFSKVRCGADQEETFPGAERYFGDDVASEDRASEELLPSYSDRHHYVIRCTPGEEALVVDGLEVRLTKHMESALGLLCFSAGLHGHDNATRNLGRLRTVEAFNPEEYSLEADGSKRIDILYKDNISRCDERIFSMMPECQARPVRFEVNGRQVRTGGLMWRLYRSLLCGAAAGDASAEDAAGQMDEDEYQSPLYVASNVHNYAIRCRRGSERLLVDGVRVRASRHLLAVLRFLCDVIEVSTALPEGGVFSFGDLATRDPFATAEFVARADASTRSFDVQYTQPTNRADRQPTSLRSICEPEAQFILDGHRLAPHTLVWSLFHHLRCRELASSQPTVQT
ncbi:hypothetical protein R5R35_001670 [Gryllus longicercus]|uniref:Uncharacterized protein n=1 Tax=Gryllus longicercus TaxID=2509291 RepID=A0AAN9VZC3_9ORTH